MIDQQTLVHAFVENLSDLHSKLDKLCKLLLQEETALADQNYDAIKQIAIEKNQLTAQVEQAERCRLSQCDKLQIEPDKQGAESIRPFKNKSKGDCPDPRLLAYGSIRCWL